MRIFVSHWQPLGSVLCCGAAVLPRGSRMGVLVCGRIPILSLVSTASSGVSRAVNSKDVAKPSQSPLSMESYTRAGPAHPCAWISTSFYLGIQHSLLCARTPRAEPLEVGDAGREGVRQEAQGPIPSVTQNCRETSNVPPATLTLLVSPQHRSMHGFSSHPCKRQADQPQADS